MRFFADRLARANPESSYDALVRFGHAPLTALVNLQWKREALQKLKSDRALRFLELPLESAALREQDASGHVETREAKRARRKGVEWKRPLCSKRKKGRKLKEKRYGDV